MKSMEHKLDLVALLGHVDPSYLDYQSWINVGMALKYEGYTASDWDEWSRRDGGRTIRANASRSGLHLKVTAIP